MTRQQLIQELLQRLEDTASDLAFGLAREQAAEVTALVEEIRRVATDAPGMDCPRLDS